MQTAQKDRAKAEWRAERQRADQSATFAAFIGAALGVSCFALYAWSAARDVMWGDGLELVASAITNGVAHPPGYPLWIVLGHLASLAPIGALAFRVNLTACAYHAATVGLVYATAYMLTRRYAASFFAALLLAVGSPLFVVWSLQAEVFSLNDLFAAAIVLLCVMWLDDARRWRLIVALGGLFGLGLSNQQTLIFLAPLVAWTAWCGRQVLLRDKRVPATIGLAALALILGFALPYSHTLLASQTLSDTHFGVARTVPQLLDLIDRKTYGSWQLASSTVQQGGTFLARLTALIAAGGWPFAFIGAGIGVLALQRRYRELVAAALLVLFPLLAICAIANNRVDDDVTSGIWARFGLLPLVALAPFSACGFAALESLVPLGRIRTAVAALALCALGVAGGRHLLGLSLAGADGPRAHSRDMFNALPRNAILMTAGDAADLAPVYFQTIEHWRPDVTVIADEFLNRISPTMRVLVDRVNVPPAVMLPLPAETQRDLLIDANRNRPFFTTGGYSIETSSSEYQPYVLGIVDRMIPSAARVDVRNHYQQQRALLSAPGYGNVAADRWTSNGWGASVRAYYADGFLSAGVNAERLGKVAEARYWYNAARSYNPDPATQSQWEARLRAEGLTIFDASPSP
jgi:hypothetical protein